ncbi:serine/threonine-protein kinase [Lentzea sp. BCCO 10_0061]|uniref:non-specific serine/threonine protein kinase n=1 Tax=Lentzea sokolovensis TaxID=3095429 RepID=A0ABU4UNW9_9PSEU|nr:serine/threonine-protein kinase [Lentzea sp. BCCO 10_0061]MDX8141193.1 serine/threonine-protein kinase [Lentzea sp. BCCO 10_0061]
MIRFEDNDGAEWRLDEDTPIGDRGGMGQVFAGLAADGTSVAIKKISLPRPTESKKRQRDREIEIVERLLRANRSGHDTSHLVLPHGYRFLDDDLLIVMPRAEKSLKAALVEEPFPTAAGVDVVRQVALGLQQLSRQSIVHRDLKPANVLKFGPVWKIADFGLSRDLSEATGTYTLAAYGTDPYTAPELWLNHPADAMSDLYALGVLAFEVFTGELPFKGPEDDFRRQHLQDAPPSLDGLSPKIARHVLRLLHKRPSERPQDARAVYDGLAPYALTPQQDSLVNAALGVEQRLMTRQTSASAAEADTERQDGLRRRALADLDEILADAHDDLREALPDVKIDEVARTVSLGDLVIAFETFEPLRLSTRDTADRAVLLGVVREHTRDERPQSGAVHAHLRYGPDADQRFGWTFTGPTPADVHQRALDAAAVLDLLRTAMESHAGRD